MAVNHPFKYLYPDIASDSYERNLGAFVIFLRGIGIWVLVFV
jgi:hypothetical protein